MDLTPRPPDEEGGRAGRRRRRRGSGAALLAVVLVGAAVVLWQGLSNATLYFCNADEVEQRAECSGDGRFRLQGVVVPGSVRAQAGEVDFDVEFGGATVAVRHTGDPPQLFQEGIAVVLEGRNQPDAFESDRIMVKHSEEYKAENPDRVDPAAP